MPSLTLAIFSGVRDPEWLVTSTDPNYMKIRTRLIAAIQNYWAYLPEDLPPVPGYKGILVARIMNKKKSVVQGMTGERLIVGPITVQLQMVLFNTMPKNESFPPEKLRKQISKMIASGAVRPQKSPKKTKRHAPEYQTAPWVTRNRQLNNNGYNYATTIPTGTRAQPGRATGHMQYPPINGVNVLNSAVWDGLAVLNVAIGGPVPVNPPNQDHVVALVVCQVTFSLHTSLVDHEAGTYPRFRRTKRLGVCLFPSGWDAGLSQRYPISFLTNPSQTLILPVPI